MQQNLLSKLLLNGLDKTSFCSADDELRPIMNGVYFDITTGQINFVASDSHKLALLEHTDSSISKTINFVLPQKIANILKNNLHLPSFASFNPCSIGSIISKGV